MAQADERKKLTEWVENISKDVKDLILDHHIFWEVQQIIRSNPRFANVSGVFTQWMASNFIQAAAVGVRRQADLNPDCISLRKFLREVKNSPALLSREYYVSVSLQAAKDWPEECAEGFANGLYDQLVGLGMSQPAPAQVQSEIDELVSTTERIRGFVDRRVAHVDRRGLQQPLPTFDGLADCLVLLERLMVKYYNLLTATDSGELLPQTLSDWKAIFRFPWLEGPTKSGIPGRETSP